MATPKRRLERDAVEAVVNQLKAMLVDKQSDLERWDAKAQAEFRSWFGTTDEAARTQIVQRLGKLQRLLETYSDSSFRRSEDPYPFVDPRDERTVYVHASAPLSAVTLAHELSHFSSIGATKDYAYGPRRSRALAREYPEKALRNADNFAFYMEEE